MQQMHRVAAGLAVVVADGLVPGAPAAVGSETGERHRAAASCVDEGGSAAVRNPKLVRTIDTGETGWFSSPRLVDLSGKTSFYEWVRPIPMFSCTPNQSVERRVSFRAGAMLNTRRHA